MKTDSFIDRAVEGVNRETRLTAMDSPPRPPARCIYACPDCGQKCGCTHPDAQALAHRRCGIDPTTRSTDL